eukprot:scaffold108848_cov91-Attheya_sp.AAC.1
MIQVVNPYCIFPQERNACVNNPVLHLRYLYWNYQLGNDDKEEHVVFTMEQFIYIIDVTTSSVAVLME